MCTITSTQCPLLSLDKLVVEMDSLNMGVMVNLSGFRGKILEWSLDNVKQQFPKTLCHFSKPQF
ncbi:MAG: hypothetical protein WDN75_15300 [Bacteroidota bacterium]